MSVSDATFFSPGVSECRGWHRSSLATRDPQSAERVTSLTKLALPSTNALCFHFDNENRNTRTTESEKPVLAVPAHKRALRKHRLVMKILCRSSRVNTRSRTEALS